MFSKLIPAGTCSMLINSISAHSELHYKIWSFVLGATVSMHVNIGSEKETDFRGGREDRVGGGRMSGAVLCSEFLTCISIFALKKIHTESYTLKQAHACSRTNTSTFRQKHLVLH